MTQTEYEIPFTQFLLPNGKQREQFYTTENKEVYDKAMQIISAGFRFEVELLTTGHASATIGGLQQFDEDDEPEMQDVAFVIAANGPPLVEKIERMIMEFDIPEDGVVRSWKSGNSKQTT
jgi:hypothetical protein